MLAGPPGPGRVILNVCSASGVRGRAGLAHYTASKHGVTGLARSLAVELGSHGVRVLVVAPTLTDTPGFAERRAAPTQDVAAMEDKLSAQPPLGRIATPDDVARGSVLCQRPRDLGNGHHGVPRCGCDGVLKQPGSDEH